MARTGCCFLRCHQMDLGQDLHCARSLKSWACGHILHGHNCVIRMTAAPCMCCFIHEKPLDVVVWLVGGAPVLSLWAAAQGGSILAAGQAALHPLRDVVVIVIHQTRLLRLRCQGAVEAQDAAAGGSGQEDAEEGSGQGSEAQANASQGRKGFRESCRFQLRKSSKQLFLSSECLCGRKKLRQQAQQAAKNEWDKASVGTVVVPTPRPVQSPRAPRGSVGVHLRQMQQFVGRH